MKTRVVNAAKQGCPLSYAYRPSSLAHLKASKNAEVLYVIGGLYGNRFALDRILEMSSKERNPPLLVFNGDFNFFNANRVDYRHINSSIQRNGLAIRGNIEDTISKAVEAQSPSEIEEVDCGCSYPPYVSTALIGRSNTIATKLSAVAVAVHKEESTYIQRWLRQLEKYMVVSVGRSRVCIVHGDMHSLSGWDLSAEAMPQSKRLRDLMGVNEGENIEITTEEKISSWIAESNADIIACTHTCLPFALDVSRSKSNSKIVSIDSDSVRNEGCRGIVINNGSAGMANFRGSTHGVITRISTTEAAELPPGRRSLYCLSGDHHEDMGVSVDALAVDFDYKRWEERFLEHWPPGSAAHTSYIVRIKYGPDWGLDEATMGNFHVI